MLRLKSDLVELCDAAIDKTLSQIDVEWDERVALGVVMAAGGYPHEYETGKVISGLGPDPAGCRVFHAGTRSGPEGIVTAGGRVLCVCALGDTVSEAKDNAYKRVAEISWEGAFYRTDIGKRAIEREEPLA